MPRASAGTPGRAARRRRTTSQPERTADVQPPPTTVAPRVAGRYARRASVQDHRLPHPSKLGGGGPEEVDVLDRQLPEALHRVVFLSAFDELSPDRVCDQLSEPLHPQQVLVAEEPLVEPREVLGSGSLQEHGAPQQLGELELAHHPVQVVALGQRRAAFHTSEQAHRLLREDPQHALILRAQRLEQHLEELGRGRLAGVDLGERTRPGPIPLPVERGLGLERIVADREPRFEQCIECCAVLGPLHERGGERRLQDRSIEHVDVGDRVGAVERLHHRDRDAGVAEAMGEWINAVAIEPGGSSRFTCMSVAPPSSRRYPPRSPHRRLGYERGYRGWTSDRQLHLPAASCGSASSWTRATIGRAYPRSRGCATARASTHCGWKTDSYPRTMCPARRPGPCCP